MIPARKERIGGRDRCSTPCTHTVVSLYEYTTYSARKYFSILYDFA